MESDAVVLTLKTLLTEAGIEESSVVAFRHRPAGRKLQEFLPSYVVERPELFHAYQTLQTGQAAAMLRGAKVLASFIGQDTGRATFAGLYEVRGSRSLAPGEACGLPHVLALVELGMALTTEEGAADVLFDLQPMDALSEWIGKLIVEWPSRGINWKLRVEGKVFKVAAIAEESRFVRPMPSWRALTVDWSDLAVLPRSWRDILTTMRGVYYIYDRERRAGYVGSAAGQENLLGRWRNYADTGHGGDVRLRESRPENLSFSVLELALPEAPLAEVIALETSWKERLHTRTFGLNAN